MELLFPIGAAKGSGSTVPEILTTSDGVSYAAFDSGTDEILIWDGLILPETITGPFTAHIVWSGSSSTTTSHTVRWAVRIQAFTPEVDGAMDASSFDTANEVDDDILGTTAKRGQLATVTLTNNDSMAGGDHVTPMIFRNADHANDDLPEDAWLWGFKIADSG